MTHSDTRNRPPGRLRAAWQVLMGRRTTPAQIEAEWIEYKMIFDDVLTRFSAQLARQAKAERAALKRQLDVPENTPPVIAQPVSRKAVLRSRAAAMRGLGPYQAAAAIGQLEMPTPVGNGNGDEDEP